MRVRSANRPQYGRDGCDQQRTHGTGTVSRDAVVSRHSTNAPMRSNFCRRSRRRSADGSEFRKSSSTGDRITEQLRGPGEHPGGRRPRAPGTITSTTPRAPGSLSAVGRSAAAARRASPASFQRIAAHPSGEITVYGGVLLHQHPVGHSDGKRAARAALADHAGDDRHVEPHQQQLRAGDRARTGHAVPRRPRDRRPACRSASRPGTRASPPSFEHPHRLAVALRGAASRSCGRHIP